MFLDWRDLCTCETRDFHPKSPRCGKCLIQLSQLGSSTEKLDANPQGSSIAKIYKWYIYIYISICVYTPYKNINHTYGLNIYIYPIDIQWLLLNSRQVVDRSSPSDWHERKSQVSVWKVAMENEPCRKYHLCCYEKNLQVYHATKFGMVGTFMKIQTRASPYFLHLRGFCMPAP